MKTEDKRYIIRNCPAIYGIDDGFLCSYREDDESEKYCYDNTDCLLKQIVELCLEYPNQCKIEGNCIDERCCSSCFLGGGCELAQDILNLLQIEEIK